MTLRLNGSSSGFTEVKAPAAAGSNTITLPTSNGSAEQFLKNSGTAGTLEYSSMVETSTGIGIGTTSPTNQLHIYDGTGANDQAELKIESFRPGIRFQDRSSSSASAEIIGDNGLKFNVSAPVDDDTALTERARLTSDGVVLIGKTSESRHTNGVEIKDNGGSDGHIVVTNNGLSIRVNQLGSSGEVIQMMQGGSIVGRITVTSSSTSYNTSSDYRLKENVVDLGDAIDRVKQLAPKRFNFIVDADTTVDGFLAHEAQTVVPEAVTGTHNEVDDDGNAVMQGIDQSKLVPLLTAALQEAISKIETLETKVAALEAA